MENAKILIADDEANLRELLKEVLASRGYQVVESSDGHETCNIAQEEQPSLILLDLNMPVFNGIEVLKRLKGEPMTHAIPVVVLTARRNPKWEAEAMRLGAVDFVTKPFNMSDVLDRVHLALTLVEHRRHVSCREHSTVGCQHRSEAGT